MNKVDLLFLSDICCMIYGCICMAYSDSSIFILKLNLMITELEHKVGWVMVPLNRANKCNHICLSMGRLLVVPLSCLLSVPPTREGYGRALPWPDKQT